MESPSEAERRRAQNRENLRAHYGLTKGNSPLSPLSESTKPLEDTHRNVLQVGVTDRDVLNPDSPSFSAEQYYTNLVTSSSLPQLMRTSVKLSNDAKTLKSSRHDLVYNHHHQLFSAGDTISQLNSKTPQLQSIVNSLQESFNEISTLVANVEIPKDKRGEERNKGREQARTTDKPTS